MQVPSDKYDDYHDVLKGEVWERCSVEPCLLASITTIDLYNI